MKAANMKLEVFIFVAYFAFEFGPLGALGDENHNETENCECGIRNLSNDEVLNACSNSSQTEASAQQNTERVMHGDVVNPPYKYPWMVSVFKNTLQDCTGTLVSRHYVITAAHCVQNSDVESHKSHTICYDKQKEEKNCWNDPENITVGFLTETKDFAKQVSVDKVIVHPKKDVKLNKHDLAILHLSEPSPCGKYTRPICISDNMFNDEPDVEATLIGYGASTMDKEATNTEFHEAKVKSTNKTRCENEIKDDMMCFVGVNNQSSCSGDSGGPLTLEKDGVNYLIGVLSAGTADCDVKEPSYYPSITKHFQWIQSHIKALPKAGTPKLPIDCKKGK